MSENKKNFNINEKNTDKKNIDEEEKRIVLTRLGSHSELFNK